MCRTEDKPKVLPVESRFSSGLWQLYGKHYDLTGFMQQHPGGHDVLAAVRGMEDCTALFESYHALSNTTTIRKTLEMFIFVGKVIDDVTDRETKLNGEPKNRISYSFKDGEFYATVKERVKAHFLQMNKATTNKAASASANAFIKAPPLWYIKVALIFGLYSVLFLSMLGFDVFRLGVALSYPARCGLGWLAGALLQSFSFCTLHDASHYGIWSKRPRTQQIVSRVCNAWTLWNHAIWFTHHVYGHHSFTGDYQRDPDMVHARPFIRKSKDFPIREYFPSIIRFQPLLTPIFMLVLPGQTLGQTISYWRGSTQGHLWKVHLGPHETRWYEYALYALNIVSHLTGRRFWVSFCYFMGTSMAYHLCVAPDHDTFETAITNSIESKHEVENEVEDSADGKGLHGDPAKGVLGETNLVNAKVEDWGEVQVRHSGNFSMDNWLLTHMMGGINYQIEHHLFPSMSHMHYQDIAPIVQATCDDFGVPYSFHPTLWSAYISFLKNMKHCSCTFSSKSLCKLDKIE